MFLFARAPSAETLFESPTFGIKDNLRLNMLSSPQSRSMPLLVKNWLWSQQLGHGYVLHFDADVHLLRGCGKRIMKFNWALTGENFPFKIVIDFVNKFWEAEELLSMYYGATIRIFSPTGKDVDKCGHVVTSIQVHSGAPFLVVAEAMPRENRVLA
jgi:hypothetical protein